MRLISTLRYGYRPPLPPAGISCGGDLRLFFTTLNPNDAEPVDGEPGSVFWQVQGKGVQDIYTLPNGSEVHLNLFLQEQVQNQIYIEGSIDVSGGPVPIPVQHLVASPGTVIFKPGSPSSALLSASAKGQHGGKNFEVSFELMIPWNGTTADCPGKWRIQAG